MGFCLEQQFASIQAPWDPVCVSVSGTFIASIAEAAVYLKCKLMVLKEEKIALAGKPNSGKSSLFNRLTA